MSSLVIVAHPDDEVLWFYSVLARDVCDVVVVTNGRDEADRSFRLPAFRRAMVELGVRTYWMWQYPDTQERLDVESLTRDLGTLKEQGYSSVYTHSPYGEVYEHKHHQDVSYAVHQVFRDVHSVSWNAFPTMIRTLSRPEFDHKRHLMGTVYGLEYRLLKSAYPLSAVEAFSTFSKESVEIFYWSTANFGDAHERLGRRFPDFWGFRRSAYERERHEAITRLVRALAPKSILEFGACEGVLSSKLLEVAPVTCVEKAPVYRELLSKEGYTLIDEPETDRFDVAVVASFLEYLTSPHEFLRTLRSRGLVVETIAGSKTDNMLCETLSDYGLISETMIEPRWEGIEWGDTTEELGIYRLGAHVCAFEKKRH